MIEIFLFDYESFEQRDEIFFKLYLDVMEIKK